MDGARYSWTLQTAWQTDDFVSESKIGAERFKEIVKEALSEPKPQKFSLPPNRDQPKD
jgi:hypothetical protein